ncbi:MAG: hypothetical protein QXS19_06500 [Candidatus Methanomethylicia archaeon]
MIKEIDYTVEEITLSIFTYLIIETYEEKEIYRQDEVEEFVKNLLEKEDFFTILNDIINQLEIEISPNLIYDYIYDNFDLFIIKLTNYLNNKDKSSVQMYTNYIASIYNLPDGIAETLNNIIDIDINTEDIDIVIMEDLDLTKLRFRYIIHEHRAEKAGLHYDLRIEIAKDKIISIAFRNYPLGKDRAMGIIQPLHESYWMTFQGEIKQGYGKGKLKIVDKGLADFFVTERKTLVLYLYSIQDGKLYKYAIIFNKNPLFVKTDKDYEIRFKNKRKLIKLFSK